MFGYSFSRALKLSVFCGSLTLTGLYAAQLSAGATSVGSTPVFVPPVFNTQPPESEERAPSASRPAGNPAAAAAMVSSLQQVTVFCGNLADNEYVIDCLAERLEAVSRSYRNAEGLEDAQKAIADASRQLNEIARENRSKTKKPTRYQSKGANPVRTSRRLTAVATAKLDSAIAKALAVIENTETVLLRASDKSVERAAQFQRIADAIGSNKVLLRSV